MIFMIKSQKYNILVFLSHKHKHKHKHTYHIKGIYFIKVCFKGEKKLEYDAQ